jgi:hypothetical protein
MSRLCLLALLLAACRTEPIPDELVNTTPAATVDFSTGGARDMSVPPASRSGCHALAICVFACEHNNTCLMGCMQSATMRARDLFNTVASCIQKHCGATGQCVFTGMGFTADPPNLPPGTCNHCLGNGYSALGGQPCTPPNSPDCNPAECSMFVQTCLAN